MRTLLFLLCIGFATTFSAQNTYVPDDNFEQALIDMGYDNVLDDYVPTANIQNIIALDLSGKNISDLTGIEDFTSLVKLNCRYNNLSTVDVSNNTGLEELWLSDNQLTAIDLSQNTALVKLYLSNNQLTSLNISANTNLEELSCDENQLTNLDLSQNLLLRKLWVMNNQLTDLDLSQHTQLDHLDCQNNQLVSLNVKNGNNTAMSLAFKFRTTGNPGLTCIQVDDPAWSTATWTFVDPQQFFSDDCTMPHTYIPDDNFEQKLIDSGYDNLLNNYVPTNNIQNITSLNLTNLNISDLTGIEDFTSLSVFNCSNNNIAAVDLSNNTALTYLSITNNQLTDLDVSALSNLNTLYAGENNLGTINLSANTALQVVSLSGNPITVLDLSANTQLQQVYLEQTNLLTLNLSMLPALTRVFVQNNPNLKSLNLANGSNQAIANNYFNATGCPELSCITVDDPAWSAANWTNIDPHHTFGTNCAAPMTYVPDDNFEQVLIDQGYDTVLDDYVLTANIQNITGGLPLANKGITDMTGIEDFVSLKYLYINDNQISSLDISNLTFLEYLRVQNNQLTSLDISANIRLISLHATNNNISNIDVSNNPDLVGLYISGNPVSNLDVSQNPKLKKLYANQTQIAQIDVSANPLLEDISLQNTPITSLDLSQNPNLLSVKTNNATNLNSLDLRNGNNQAITNTNFNTTGCPALSCIDVDDPAWSAANWTNIDPQQSFNISCNGQVTYVPDDNFEQLLISLGYDTVLDDYVLTANIENITELGTNIGIGPIADFTGLEDFGALERLLITHSSTTYLDLSQNINLKSVNLSHCSQLTGVNFSTLANLESVLIQFAPLSSIDVSQNTTLYSLILIHTQIASLDLTQNTNLIGLEITQASLTTLDLSQNTLLKSLRLSSLPQLNTLDLTNNTGLESLYLSDLPITALDLSQNTALETINCIRSQFTSINLSQKPVLTELECYNNQLTSLDVTQSPALVHLHCSNNQLASLDVSQNPALEELYCSNNLLTELNVKNGNNTIIDDFETTGNPDLTCIQVDDPAWSAANWTVIDPHHYFSDDCNYQSIDNAIFADVTLYPNPSEGRFYIKTGREIRRVEIYDTNGKLVLRDGKRNQYDVTELVPGIYMVRIITDRVVITKKLTLK